MKKVLIATMFSVLAGSGAAHAVGENTKPADINCAGIIQKLEEQKASIGALRTESTGGATEDESSGGATTAQ